MEESSFDIDAVQLAEASRRFPARPQQAAVPTAGADLEHLSTSSGDGFASHAWDEGGRP